MVSLLVGEEREVFKCQRALLGYFSRVFERALYGHFAEACQDYMHLPDDERASIQAFIKWIDTGEVDLTISPLDPVFAEKLWVLADKIDAPKFLNPVVDILFKKYNQEIGISIEAVKYIQETAPGSKLRRLLVEAITFKGPLHEKRRHRRDEWKALILGGGDFVLDVVMAGGFTNDNGVNYEDGTGPTLSSSDTNQRYIEEPLIYNPKTWRQGDIDQESSSNAADRLIKKGN